MGRSAEKQAVAMDLLRHANLTVTEICILVGFSSVGSFSSLFTRLVGESPTAYRNRWAARGGPHVPGCYLFMRGPGQLRATAGPVNAEPGPPEGAPAPDPEPLHVGYVDDQGREVALDDVEFVPTANYPTRR